MTKKKEKILLDLSGKKSIFDNDKNVGWGGISPERAIEIGRNIVKQFENTTSFDYEQIAKNQYLKAHNYFNSAHTGNYNWYNEHTNGLFNNEDYYLPDWNF